MEDLWSFNDEQLVRTLAQCPIPTISAIGHQTDFVLTDFAADFRAETPSAAAEWISSKYLAQIDRLSLLEQSILRISVDFLSRKSEKLTLLGAALERLSPQVRMDRYHQQLDELECRLIISRDYQIEKIKDKLDSLEQRLYANSLPSALKRGFCYLSDEDGLLIRSIKKLSVGKQIRAHLEDGSRPLEVLGEDLD